MRLFRFISYSVSFNNLFSKESAHFIKVFEFDIVLFKKLPDHPFNVYVICNGVLLFIFLFWIIFFIFSFLFQSW